MIKLYEDFKNNNDYNYQIVQYNDTEDKDIVATFVDKRNTNNVYTFKCNELDGEKVLFCTNTYENFFILTEDYIFVYGRDWASSKPQRLLDIKNTDLSIDEFGEYINKASNIKIIDNTLFIYLKTNDKLPEFLQNEADRYDKQGGIVIISDNSVVLGKAYVLRYGYENFNFIETEDGFVYTYIEANNKNIFINNKVMDYIIDKCAIFDKNKMDFGMEFMDETDDFVLSYFDNDDLILEFISPNKLEAGTIITINNKDLQLYRSVNYNKTSVYRNGGSLSSRYVKKYEVNQPIEYMDLIITNPYKSKMKEVSGFEILRNDFVAEDNKSLNEKILYRLERYDSDDLSSYVTKNISNLEVYFNPKMSSIIHTVFLKNTKNNKLSVLYYSNVGDDDGVYFAPEIFNFDEKLLDGFMVLNRKLQVFEFYMPCDSESNYYIQSIIWRESTKNGYKYETIDTLDRSIYLRQWDGNISPEEQDVLIGFNSILNKKGDGINALAFFRNNSDKYSLQIKIIEIVNFKPTKSYYIDTIETKEYTNVEGVDVANFRGTFLLGLSALVSTKKMMGLKNSYVLYKLFKESDFIKMTDLDGDVLNVVLEVNEWISAEKQITYYIDADKERSYINNGRTLVFEINNRSLDFFELNDKNYNLIGKIADTDLTYVTY